MIQDPVRIYEAFDDQTGGVDGQLATLLLAGNRAAKLVNGTVRGGNASTRPSFGAIPLTFESDQTRALFERFPIQGGKYYWHPATDGMLICSIGGRIFAITVFGNVQDITPADGPNSATIPQVWMEQVDQYMVIQNGQDKAIIVEALTSRRADPDKTIIVSSVEVPAPEVPTGTVMGFGLNRLVLASVDRTTFKIGDIAGGSTTVLTFSATQYLNEAPEFQMPRQLGRIVAITFLAQADTANGIGSCLVIGERGILAMDLTVPRTDWLDTDISRIVLLDTGGVGSSALTQVNGDLFFRSKQGGIRSLRMARAEMAGWGKTPISREVSNYLDYDTPRLLSYCQMARFDNRLFCTVVPTVADGHPNHLGMLILNFDLVSSLAGKVAPAWEGLWTGITPTVFATGLFDGEERFLTLCHDQDGINRLYEIRKEDTFDIETQPIPSVIHTRAMSFDSPFSRKELIGADIWLTNILGETRVVVKWRPNGYPEWTDWASFTVCAGQGSGCATGDCQVLALTPRAVQRIILPRPPKSCAADGSNSELAFGYAFEFRIEWEGRATISRFRAHANRLLEQSLNDCPTDTHNNCGSVQVCADDDFTYNLSLEAIGCVDSVVFSSEITAPESIDFRPWKNTVVNGATWIIEGIDGSGNSIPYLKGAIGGNRMLGMPDFVTIYHPTVRLVTYCVDPYGEAGNEFIGYSGYSGSA
jgi:hypothetical protein